MRRNLNRGTGMQIWCKEKQGSSCTSVPFVAQIRGAPGFSLVELLTVVAVISALAIIAIPAGSNYINKAKTARCLGDLQTLNNEIQGYNIDRNSYPDSLNDIGRGTFTDPWGQTYKYSKGASLLGAIDPEPLNDGSNDYDLWGKGPDRQTNNAPDYIEETCADDIVRASDGISFGVRSDF